jgi:hypothetical protein
MRRVSIAAAACFLASAVIAVAGPRGDLRVGAVCLLAGAGAALQAVETTRWGKAHGALVKAAGLVAMALVIPLCVWVLVQGGR